MNGVVPSPRVAEKALRLVGERRVFMRESEAIVLGSSAVWHVEARSQGVVCDCLAGANLDPVSCSHKVAAQIVWGSE